MADKEPDDADAPVADTCYYQSLGTIVSHDLFLVLQLYIISGRDGSTLWHTRSRTIQMNSDLSLTTKGSRDLFLFRTVGGHVASSEATDGFRPLSQSGHRTVGCLVLSSLHRETGRRTHALFETLRYQLELS